MTHLLYVEDEPFLAKIVRESLEGRGYRVTHVANGTNVLRAFEQHPPDLVLLDVMLPGRDGWEIARDLRARNATVPIIFLTAKNQTEDVLRGFRTGGNDYMRKPFSVEELVARMENLLSLRPTEPPPSEYKFGTFRWHPTTLRLEHPERARTLSNREAELLQLLAENQGETVERPDILRTIWGDDSIFHSRTLDVYITKLRRYLRLDERVRILTLKGVGYRLVVVQP